MTSRAAPMLPRGPMRLRHAPLVLDLPPRMVPAWSVPLAGCGPRLALTSADGRALLVLRDGVLVLGDHASGDVSTWRRIALPPGHPGTAVGGPLPWIADDGRVLRWNVDGRVDDCGSRAAAAIGLDDARMLLAPLDEPGAVVLHADGAERWRAPGTLADACPGPEVFIVGIPGNAAQVAAIELSTGRVLWSSTVDPMRLAALVAVYEGMAWVACTDRTLAALSLESGRLVHALDTGVRTPCGGVDPMGDLHLCNELAWVSARLAPQGNVRRRLRLSGVGRMVDPPLPVAAERLLVRTVAGEVLLLEAAGPVPVWRGPHPVWGVAAERGRLYLLEGRETPVLHCLVESSPET